MAELKKVIEGLEICTMTTRANRCLKCPYTKEERDTNKWCTHGLHRDALSLLKAQEPRVMTLEEVAELEEHQFVWLEGSNSDEPIYCFEIVQLCGIVSINMEIALNTPSFICYVYTKDYNKKYRIWASRPTDEQREAVKWE